MSSLVVQVTTIDDVRPHPNADRLELATVGGWQVVIPKETYQTDDTVVFFPPDTILPQEVSDRFGVTQYLSRGRIKHTRLRGEPSFGLVVTPDQDWPVGADVAAHYGATKYEPPVRTVNGPGKPTYEHPKFKRYTEIENLRHYKELFLPAEEVVITEKIHGANCRVGVIDGKIVAGSRRLQRVTPTGKGDSYADNTYWTPWFRYAGVRELLTSFIEPQTFLQRLFRRPQKSATVILYGEVFGPSIQSFNYGLAEDSLDFRAFDISIDGVFVSYDTFEALCEQSDIPMAPVLYRGSFEGADIPALSEGKTTVGGTHIREGVVVKPVHERKDPRLGRIIAKYVSDSYLLKDKKTDYTEE